MNFSWLLYGIQLLLMAGAIVSSIFAQYGLALVLIAIQAMVTILGIRNSNSW